MEKNLTIVMYHYVRELELTRYPGIKGLRKSEFKNQLRYLKSKYTIISPQELRAHVVDDNDLPQNALLLTFDDGYIDHFNNVFPLLFDENLSACFYPPVSTVKHRTLLDVNRIHFLLAAADANTLLGNLDEAVEHYHKEYNLDSVETYKKEWSIATRFDGPEIIYIKRMLQTVLPIELRNIIAKDLFAKYVSSDEHAFSEELYMNLDQAKLMVENGMHFGSHGNQHKWLNHVSAEEQCKEIDTSLSFLKEIGSFQEDFWTMAYPYGGWDEDLLNVLRARNCKLAFTTRVATADLSEDDPLLLPRWDTNDFPKTHH